MEYIELNLKEFELYYSIIKFSTIMDPNISIKSLMTSNLVTVKENDTIDFVREIYRNNSFHHLPVLSKGRKLKGIISKSDLLKVNKIYSIRDLEDTINGIQVHQILAKDIMTKYPLTLEPNDSIGLAADIFLANQFHALPVVEDEELLGIITVYDLLAYGYNSPLATKMVA